MKKVVFFLAFIAMGVATVSAQTENNEPGRNTTFVKNGFWDNWFIGAGASGNVYFGDDDADAKFLDRITVAPTIQFGKWFNPYFGARVRASGLTNLHTFNNNASTMTRNKFVSTDVTLMWNMTNYFMNYNRSRVYNFIPFAGAGWTYTYDYKNLGGLSSPHHVHSATIDVGIINRFNLISDKLALDIEFSGKLLKDEVDRRSHTKHSYDVLGSASASLVYTLGNKGFEVAELRDQSEIDALNNTINNQRAQIASLTNRPAVKSEPEVVVKEVVKVVEKSQEPVNNVVLFPLNGTKIQSHQEVNIYNVAKYLKDNASAKVRVIGYTDKATGTPAINEKLSRQRAQNVADLITGKYGISPERVKVEWEGMANPPFSTTEWNRAVIMYIE
ncbi:OmpA family protein [Dysgonomonas sp. 216]|uniref:OmpA family protein n=1 Tax=Dysgonomonas sp. 216 TaxID=2302934 RepID=UPI0013CF5E09|nr:OmpA family protein [Dysgonomonas sp. 216]NDW19721.1 OmpA family protein [Dysgonomonas sp. 216]